MNDNELELQERSDAEDVDVTAPARVFDLTLTFEPEGIKIDLKSNLSPLEQLGAIDIFRQHVLNSAMGTPQS